ncbi:MAG: hypothetical protein IPF95_01090 [Flavobacteriales bacterium]|nr:hypothetical protein [Flavobacteriales bacterium]MBK7298736.1 hypothetical protein [Flavobacteriales bacterium]HQV53663.1 hypothetical protein [Flavobacteriales bacterium]HQZ42041.1 hypothetical protein [Flavobacteriales bacterium]
MVNHIRGAPLPPVESRSLDKELLAYGLLARVVLDGSTLRAEQVLLHLEGRLRVPASQSQDLGDLDNLYHASKRLQTGLSSEQGTLSPERILELHGALTQIEGKKPRSVWRDGPMPPGGLSGVPSEMIPLFMVELCDWLNGPELQPPTPEETPHYAILRSLISELYLSWIQPFNVAGYRLAGLIGQQLLSAGGLSGSWTSLSAVHYHRTRPEFLRQISHAAQGVGDPIPFLAYSLKGLLDRLRELSSAIRNAQVHGQWRAHIEDLFEDIKGPQRIRQRTLLLGLSEEKDPVPIGTIALLNPELARLYAGVSSKTLQRDIDALEDLGAVQRDPEGVRARREMVLGFRG